MNFERKIGSEGPDLKFVRSLVLSGPVRLAQLDLHCSYWGANAKNVVKKFRAEIWLRTIEFTSSYPSLPMIVSKPCPGVLFQLESIFVTSPSGDSPLNGNNSILETHRLFFSGF